MIFWQPQWGMDDARWETKQRVHQGYMALEVGSLHFRRFDGSVVALANRELVQRHPVAAVLPYDTKRDQVVMVEQVRVGCVGSAQNPWLLEIVAGVIDAGESPKAAAQRELWEETQLTAQAWQPISNYWPSPGGTNEQVHLYCAHVDAGQLPPHTGMALEGEDLKCHAFPRKQALALLDQGVINNAPSIIALQWLARQCHEQENQSNTKEDG